MFSNSMSRRKLVSERAGLGIGTWNVRTMNEGRKLENLKKELERLGILGISEIRWLDGNDCD